MNRRRLAALTLTTLLLTVLALGAAAPAQAAPPEDWPTYLHDNQRTSTNQTDTTISAANASQLAKKWTFATGGPVASGVTIVGGTAYVGSWDGYEYALDAGTGSLIWKTFLGITTANPICSPPKAGVSSTATVQNGVLYVGGGDSNWYALDTNSGAVLWKIPTGDNSAAGGHYNWSSPLVYNGNAYVGIASMGDCPLVQGQLLQVNLATHQVANTFNVVPNGLVGGGIWTSPAVDPATNTVFVTTGTINDPSENLAQAVLALDATSLTLKSSWAIPPPDTVLDSDWGTSPVLYTDQNQNQRVAAIAKNGYAYSFDRNNLAAGPVWRQKIAVGGQCPLCGDGSVSSAAFAQGTLFLGGGNTTIGGQGYAGFVRALDPATGNVKWEHGTPGVVLPALASANGLVVDGAGATLEVLNATTGARLYSYTTGGTLYAPPSVANGTVYVSSTDGTVYALALPATPPLPPPPDANCPAPWTCQDIGNPQPVGSESVSGGSWTLTAGGAGTVGTVDQFRLASQNLNGDTQAIARLASLQSSTGAAQAGLMLRQNADPGSPDYEVMVGQSGTLAVSYRSRFGAATGTVNTVSGVTPPIYLEVQRRGDTFTAATSTDGVTFTLVPGATVTLQLPSTVMSGLAVTSDGNGTGANARIDSVVVGSPTNQPQPARPANACPSGWSCADVGNPLVVGNQSLSSGSWTIQGGGGDIWEYSDQLHYVWQPLAGDGNVTARVVSQTNTSGFAKAGVMLRQSTSAGSPEYSALVTPSNGLLVQYRDTAGLRTTQALSTPVSLPVYIQVARSQGYFSAYTSNDGVNWTYIAGSSVQLNLPTGLLAGLAVTSHDVTTLGSATMDHVSVGNTAPPPPTACPATWSCADIGNPTPSGAQSLSNGTWTIQGGGGDIWNIKDEFHFVWQSLAGDGTVTGRLSSQTPTDPWAKAGMMFRQTADPSSPEYSAFITPSNGLVVQYRSTQGGGSSQAVSTTGTMPTYLEVSRSMGVFTTYTSADGVTWTPVPGSSVNMSWSGSMLAGMAVTSHNTAQASTVQFDRVQVTNGSPPPPTTCPNGWTCTDVGNATPTGAQSLSNGTWNVQGGGGDIWGSSDQFHYVSQALAADGTISAHVNSQTNTDPWAKAGVMLRQSADPGAPYYAAYVTPANGIVVQYRTTQGGAAAQAVQIAGTAPAYLQVGRAGATYVTYTSSNGTTWSLLPGSTVNLGLTGGLLAGLAVTSHNVGAVSSVVFDTVSLSNTAPVIPGCPSGWTCTDVGNATPAGGQSLSNGTWNVQGGGGDIWGTSDQFHFVSQTLAADGAVTARVNSQTNTNAWAKAGVMLRQNADPGSPYYAAYITPGNGIVVQYRTTQSGVAAQAAQVSGTTPVYLRVTRSGGTFTAYTSSDGTTWSLLPGSAVNLGMPGTLQAGLAVTSHNVGAVSAVVFDTLSVG